MSAERGHSLPVPAPEIVMDDQGFYWRRYPDATYSMCPTTEANVETMPHTVYVPRCEPSLALAEIAKHLPEEMVTAFYDAAAEAHLIRLERVAEMACAKAACDSAIWPEQHRDDCAWCASLSPDKARSTEADSA
jgi:hypothetical protein